MPSDDLTDDMLPVETDGEADGEADGLELNERQSHEIRQIFGTTLPQYLEPVEEMIEQILSETEGRESTVQAFLGTVSSLSAAASRMGFDEVFRILERMSMRVGRLSEQAGAVPQEVREALLFDLEEIKNLAEGLGGAQAAGGPRAQTIFAALRGAPGIDEAVIQKLGAAGLMTVAQLQLARPDEVSAVSGLPPEVVARVMQVVGPGAGERAADEAQAAAPRRRGVRLSREVNGVVALPLDQQSLRTHLMQKLQAQVDAEAALDEMRAEVQRLRAEIAELRAEQQRTAQRRDELRSAVRSTNDRLAERITALARVRSRHDEMLQRVKAAQQAVSRAEDRVLELRQRRETVVRQQADVGREVAGLMERVQRMIRLAARE